MPANTPLILLNGLTPQQFLTEYWQKKPLLIRAAIPDFKGLLDANALAGLACEPQVQSRLISHKPKAKQPSQRWQVQHGPFEEDDFTHLPAQDWTLLVQGVNHVLPEAQALLSLFNFIPQARLDDLMVSYAPTGGGVGPHVDSYDVFLLQGAGKRRWRISQQTNLDMLPEAPLRILSQFETEQEWVLEAGDMLYLPPQVAHWGVAEDDDCMTYSIGFRAPSARELAIEFLEEARQQGLPETLYRDPDLQVATDVAAIDAHMVNKVQQMLQQLPWDTEAIGLFLARYLSEPKAHVVFSPHRAIAAEKFNQRFLQQGLVLDLQSQMLHWQGQYFINGERIDLGRDAETMLSKLATQRRLSAQDATQIQSAACLAWLREIYLHGYADWGNA